MFSAKAKQIINLLLLDRFCPVICRRVRRESDELYGLATRYGPQSVAIVPIETNCSVSRSNAQILSHLCVNQINSTSSWQSFPLLHSTSPLDLCVSFRFQQIFASLPVQLATVLYWLAAGINGRLSPLGHSRCQRTVHFPRRTSEAD